jgi:hypothetical protein
VQSSQLPVFDDSSELQVQLAPFTGAGATSRRSGEQRVRGAHAISVQDQQPGVDGVVERERAADHRNLRGAKALAQRHRQEQSAEHRCEPWDASAEPLFDHVGNSDLVGRDGGTLVEERTSDLQREQRVAEGRLDDSTQHLPLQGQPEALREHPANRAEAQWTDGEPDSATTLECALEHPGRPRAPGEQEDGLTGVESPRGERERVRRRPVEPLHVVDGHDDRTLARQCAQDVEQREPDRVRLRSAVRILAEERRFECASLRCRQTFQPIEFDAVQQIDQAAERQLGVGAARSHREDATSPRSTAVEPGLPQGRLAYPRSADEHQRSARRIRIEELPELGKLGLAPDDLRDMLVQLLDPRSLTVAYYKP